VEGRKLHAGNEANGTAVLQGPLPKEKCKGTEGLCAVIFIVLGPAAQNKRNKTFCCLCYPGANKIPANENKKTIWLIVA
jgi:hypothetical protein